MKGDLTTNDLYGFLMMDATVLAKPIREKAVAVPLLTTEATIFIQRPRPAYQSA